MIDLEHDLAALGRSIEPEALFADRVTEAVLARSRPKPLRPNARRRVIAAVIAATALTAAFPGPRAAIARWLGFNDAVRIMPSPSPQSWPQSPSPSVPARPSATTSAAPVASSAEPVISMTLAVFEQKIIDAQDDSGLTVPENVMVLGAPVSVDVVRPPTSGAIVLTFAPNDLVPESPVAAIGASLTIMRSTLDDGFFGKTIGPDATISDATVHDTRATWIAGAPHSIGFFEDDEFVVLPTRLATNTLLWEHHGVTYRLEASVDQATAVRLAETLNTA